MNAKSLAGVLFFIVFQAAFGQAVLIADESSQSISGVSIYKYPGNYAAFKFVASNGLTIVTDPFQMNEQVNPDIVTISHDHWDHSDLSRVKGLYKLINRAGSVYYKGIWIEGIANHHDKNDTTTTNVIFIFNLNGIRLAHFASQGEMPTQSMFDQIGAVDILIIQCMASSRKLSANEVAAIIRKLKAKIVIPAHGTQGLLERHLDYFDGKKTSLPSGQLDVKKSELEKIKTPELVILDNAKS